MLESRRFLVKERVHLLRTQRIYDISDADTQETLGQAKEKISPFVVAASMVVNRNLFPTTIEVREAPDDALLFGIYRGLSLFRPKVEIRDAQGETVGYFKTKLFSVRAGFTVYDAKDKKFADVSGNLIGFEYRVSNPEGDFQMGKVTKKWGGVAKELFTSADTYLVEVDAELDDNPLAKMLVLSAALATDIIFKS